ncbi:MAG: type II toxin-antitoxin system VapC family toxin [Gammaproteobacteria bacterium]|nr:type II toxin-antitoxin system VapC family toxin [Gammaproteobacteria bacterium]
MIFIDSNVPMYLIGASHPNKARAVELVNRLVRAGERLVTDIEVYREILHRYTAIRRTDAIDVAFRSLDVIADEILTFGMREIRAAQSIIDAVDGVSARDALHVAIMRSSRIERILSFDRGFDAFPELDRLH